MLEEGSERRATFAQLRSRAHKIAVETVEKKSLSPFNGKVCGLLTGTLAQPGAAADLVITCPKQHFPMPEKLRGGTSTDKNGNSICFSFNLGQCVDENCARKHVCCYPSARRTVSCRAADKARRLVPPRLPLNGCSRVRREGVQLPGVPVSRSRLLKAACPRQQGTAPFFTSRKDRRPRAKPKGELPNQRVADPLPEPKGEQTRFPSNRQPAHGKPLMPRVAGGLISSRFFAEQLA